jgi:hypothetical protein
MLFRLIATRPLRMAGPRLVLPGDRLDAVPELALKLLRESAARLLDERDLPRLAQAVAAGRWSAPALR